MLRNIQSLKSKCSLSFQNSFSILRGYNGYNSNSTIPQLRRSIRGLTCNNILHSTSNCKSCEDTDVRLLLPSYPSPTEQQNQHVQPEQQTDTSTELTTYTDIELSQLPQNTNTTRGSYYEYEPYEYVCGYNIKRHIQCPNCLNDLQTTYTTSSFIKHKTFASSHLVNPASPVTSDLKSMKRIVLHFYQILVTKIMYLKFF